MADEKPEALKTDIKLVAFVQDVTAALLAGKRHNTPGLGTFSTCTRKATANSAACNYCNFTDAGGDTVVIHWAMEPTVEVHGSWQFVGGTGKWLAAVGGGYFFDTRPEGTGSPTTTFVGQVEFE